MPRPETVLDPPTGRSISARRSVNRLQIAIGPAGTPGLLRLVIPVVLVALAASWVLYSLLTRDSIARALWTLPVAALGGVLLWRLARRSGGHVTIVLDRARFRVERSMGGLQTSSYEGRRADLQGAVVGPHPRPGSDTNTVLSTTCTLLEVDREHRLAPWLDETGARWVADTINDFLNETVTQRVEVARASSANAKGGPKD